MNDLFPLENLKILLVKQVESSEKIISFEMQFEHTTREHPDALERVFEDVGDHVHMLPV